MPLSDDDYTRFDALGLADLVRRREVSPRELLDAAIARVERLDGDVHAVILRKYDEARAVADGPLPDGPFRGVPMLVKDIMAAVAGWPSTSGSKWLASFVPTEDTELVARMRRAGFVLFGKTNTPEFGLLPTTEPTLFGRTKNPWDLARSPGGSSGGAAAAVAARYLPIAHASDGGGSIRIPAACCGLFGLKPTRARITLGPTIGDALGGLVNENAVSRTVRDGAAFLDAVHGGMPGDPYAAPPPKGTFAEAAAKDPPKLRVALVLEPMLGTPVDPQVVEATKKAGKLLEELGHHVEEAAPPVNAMALQQSFTAVWLAGAASFVEAMTHVLGRPPADGELEPVTKTLADLGRGVPAPSYMVAQTFFQITARVVARFLQKFDVIVSPTLAELPPPLGTFDAGKHDALNALLRAGAFTPFTPLFNATGNPAASVPLFESKEGLPIGTQIAARHGEEELLFSLAAQLEKATRFSERRPKGVS